MKCKYHETDGSGNLLRRWTAAVVFAVVLLFGLAVAGCHRMLQSPEVYGMVSPVVKTYEKVSFDDGSWTANRVEKPFSVVSDEGLLSWDAAHYDEIRRYLYVTTSMWQGNFAFFPLFPLVWRLSYLGPVGISVLNWMLFAIGLVLVALIFGNSLPWWNCLLLLCAPYLVIFMVPYSEAVFFLGIAAGLYGLSHNRYWLYFLGFFLACTTRAAGNIIVVAWVIVDVLSAIYSRSGMLQLGRSLLRHLAPVVLGVLAVMLLQHIRGAEHWFEYVLAQREWGKEWAWPSWPFSDWSEEGKSVSQPLVYMLLVPSLVWLALKLWHALKPNTPPRTLDTMEQIRLLSVLFFVGNVLLALFTQQGSLFSQARLLTCTPFFCILVLDFACSPLPRAWRWGLAAAILVAVLLCLQFFTHAYMLGAWLVLLLAVMVFFGNTMRPWMRWTLLGITLAINIFWTAYLFDCFLIGGWIFT